MRPIQIVSTLFIGLVYFLYSSGKLPVLATSISGVYAAACMLIEATYYNKKESSKPTTTNRSKRDKDTGRYL